MSLEVGRVRLAEGVRALVTCHACGAVYGVSPRTFRGMTLDNKRRHADGLKPRLPTCRTCRSPRVIVVTDSAMMWWLRRYTISEIVDIAEEMWGPREKW